MRKVIQALLILGGGALAIAGFLQNNGWLAGIGGALFVAGGIVWIASPVRPERLDGGNRPKHDPTDFIGWRD